MKIEHKLKLNPDIWSHFRNEYIEFCSKEFRFYFKFGIRNTVFFLISDRKPRHNESFKLIRGLTTIESRWSFADFDHEECPNEDVSPWTMRFNRYLDRNFNTNKPVYIWVEYE